MLLDELRRGFVGLWHGTSLAFTVAFISISLSVAVFFIATHLPSRRGGTKPD